MSLLPGRILPQTEPFGTVSEDGKTVTIEKNWWLWAYNVSLQSLGTGNGIPADQLIDLESVDIDAVGTDAAVLRAPIAALANLIPTDTDPVPSLQDVRNALLLAYSALDAVDAIVAGFGVPSAKVGLTAIAGTAQTAMRSDAAPALDVSISPTWTGNHTFTPGAGIAAIFNQATGAAEAVSIVAKSGGNQPLIMGDGTVAMQFTFAGTSLQMGNSSNHPISFYTNNITRLTIAAGGGITAAFALSCNGNAPPAQVTGWGVPAAPAVVATFPATPTLGQCGQAIGQIIKDLKAFGLYGA